MGTIILSLIVAFIAIILYRLITKRNEKTVSVSVTSTNEIDAYEIFFKKLSAEMPKDFIKVTKYPTSMGFSFTLKK